MQDFADSDVSYTRLPPFGNPDERRYVDLVTLLRVRDARREGDISDSEFGLEFTISEASEEGFDTDGDSQTYSHGTASTRRSLRCWQRFVDFRTRFRSGCSRFIPALGAIIILNAICVTAFWCKALWASVVNLYHGAEPCDQPVLTYFMVVDLIMNIAPTLIFGASSPTTLRLLWGGPSLWALAGVVMVQSSSTCSETSPSMFESVSLYVHMATITYLLIFTISLCYLGDMPVNVFDKPQIPAGSKIAWELPTVKAGSKELVNKESGEFLECLICLADFGGDTETIVKTKCGHYWHRECLATWCQTRQTCPHCRAALIESRA